MINDLLNLVSAFIFRLDFNPTSRGNLVVEWKVVAEIQTY